ncbi:adenylate cyclase [Malassezia japonica]|uniref:Adenylate cyclase n=1 Tax=Malassezia japonica TaxID=223818 RepID=A0AAF0JG25_9BASI|nr:adenylate cyclase [Malassezia japonica]WFD39511.1 adenylate cyclase [Malassezia japonica]
MEGAPARPEGDGGIIEQSVAQAKHDGQSITPWQDTPPSRETPPRKRGSDGGKYRTLNPLQLFRTTSKNKGTPSDDDKKWRPFRTPRSAKATGSSDARSLQDEPRLGARRSRPWLFGRENGESEMRLSPVNDLARVASHESAASDSYGVVSQPAAALGIALDTNFDQMDDIVDRGRAGRVSPATSISPSCTRTSSRTTSPVRHTNSPIMRSRWSTDSDATRGVSYSRASTDSSRRDSGIDFHEWTRVLPMSRVSDGTGRRESTFSQMTSDSLRTDVSPTTAPHAFDHDADEPRAAPALTVLPPGRPHINEVSSTWMAPDSWAVRQHDEMLGSLHNVAGEYVDDADRGLLPTLDASGESVPTSIIVYETPTDTPAHTPPAPSTPWEDNHKRRFFAGRRSGPSKLDMLLAPELATHGRSGSVSDAESIIPSPDEQTSRLPFFLSNTGNASQRQSKPRTRHGVHPPHLPFRKFARKSGSDTPRVELPPTGLDEDAAPRATAWHFSTRRRGDSAAIEADATPVPVLTPDHLHEGGSSAMQPGVFLRIYHQDDTFSMISCALETTAAEILYVLARTVGLLDAKGHGLFLYEKGSDRPLVASERPARILRRRLLQAGYAESDGLDTLGRDDMSYVLRFVFRPDRVPTLQSVALEAQEQTYKHLNLQSMHLTMIPVFVYRHAHWIVSLDLSMNPLSDLPLDFVQLCTNLRMLRCCALSLKYVPQSITGAATLTHIDFSTNRIPELSHISLDALPELKVIKMLNNRLSVMPEYTPRLFALSYLNLSNNRFDTFPQALCDVPQLKDLDLSFNTISHIPPEIAQLTNLERLVLMGNNLSRLPDAILRLSELQTLDVRNTSMHSLGHVLSLPKLKTVLASHNCLTTLDSEISSSVQMLELAHNPLSQAQLTAPTIASLTQLDLSYANLARLNESLFRSLPALTHLTLDHNQFASLPPLDVLTALEHLSCAANALTHLPDSIGGLRALQRLDVQNNNLRALPAGLWRCPNLYAINASSNLLDTFPLPPDTATPDGQRANPLKYSLVLLRLADNRLTDDVFSVLTLLSELEVLNLSMNDLYEVPVGALAHLGELRELYLSGNKLSSLPADDMERLERLCVLFINGNKLLSLPAELGRLKRLRSLDAGNNILKYNIANWHYDWNWNANPELRYLNLSGNQRFEIKPKLTGTEGRERNIADFNRLRHLRMLGLMEVTMTHQPLPDETDDRRVRTTLSQINSMPYGIADTLGMHDALHVSDVVLSSYRNSDHEALFGLVEGHDPCLRAGSHIARYVANHCGRILNEELHRVGMPFLDHRHHVPPGEDRVETALRRAFLRLDQTYAEHVLGMDVSKDKTAATSTQGASLVAAAAAAATANGAGAQELFWGWPGTTPGTHKMLWEASATAILAYQRGHRLYIANVGDALAVLSRVGGAMRVLGTKHDPLNRDETQRIRSAEGWVSLRGYVNDKVHVARAFGHFQLTPIISACPSVQCVELTDADEFVILANAELWRYIPYQMAVDIARMDREHPRHASQRLRDIAVSYGATGHITVMVVAVGALFHEQLDANVQHAHALQRGVDYSKKLTRRSRADNDSTLARLEREVLPPIGQVALVFTDIKHSTLLWETNPGMQAAIRLHNLLLRRQLRSIGGYEAKTEGDAFMVSFPSVGEALLWCFSVQLRLLSVDWPQEILDSDDGHPVHDEDGTLIYRGLSVRMGIHWGSPVCEVDPVNNRMDYFGPMVNRAARISNAADGGQILVSRDVVNELEMLLGKYEDTETSPTEVTHPPLGQSHIPREVVFLRRLGLGIISMGERRLKGIEIPEHLSLVYPKQLSGRYRHLPGVRPSDTKLQIYEPTMELLELDQVKQIGLLCLRLEALSTGMCFPGIDPLDPERSDLHDIVRGHGHTAPPPHADRSKVVERCLTRYPELLIIATREEATDTELMHILAQLVTRIHNSISTLAMQHVRAALPEELQNLGQLLAPWSE